MSACVAPHWAVCEDVPEAILPLLQSTGIHLAFPDPLKWNVHFSPLCYHPRFWNWIRLHTTRSTQISSSVSWRHPLFLGNCPGKLQNVHHWGADKKKWHWPLRIMTPTPPRQCSSYKSLKRAPDSNVWKHHQYWCGRKFFQSFLSHRTLILIVLCSSRDARVSLKW